MKKLLAFFAFIPLLFAQAQTINITSEILNEGKEIAEIKKTAAPVGSSGIVIHKFDDKHSTIVAHATIIEKKADRDIVKFSVFKALAQEALPVPNLKPEKGDKVILKYLYDRGLIISPNKQTYDAIKKRYKDIEWIHPDLFAAELSKSGTAAPTKEDFQKFCEEYSLGIVYFAVEDIGYTVDCVSFKPVYKEKNAILSKENFKLPFYSRVEEIQTSWFSFYKTTEIKDYTNYYKNLLETK
ncbi:plasminogen-binding N-terminal domain-containing protein [Nitrosophilus alvini]|uniref:plasminogen-binding N-terminal domain-containing protein n=1 Tax=Nitrosophilus alvini TaxID=2714855 RepID=UPI00190C50DD|nr:plasminogen-binding N-terminal domain-containing protein [Nitrosophilus alvini]